jgi:hypothetical protein
METNAAKKVRIFRDEETIRKLLDESKTSKVSVKVFCAGKGIAEGTFHNWKRRYGTRKSKRVAQSGFAALQISPPSPIVEPALFATLKGIHIYQPVSAAYLKELLA